MFSTRLIDPSRYGTDQVDLSWLIIVHNWLHGADKPD